MGIVGPEMIDPLYFERYGYPHASWACLRQYDPVAWMEPPGMEPFWAAPLCADLGPLGGPGKRGKTPPRVGVFRGARSAADTPPFRHLLNMDPPEHGKYRNLLSLRFTPKTLAPKREAVAR